MIDPPRRKKVRMTADPKCAGLHKTAVYSDSIVADDHDRVRWAFVYVKAGVKGKQPLPKTPVTVIQKGCRYEPHVFGVRAGQEMLIRNEDELLHNIHATPFTNKEFNIGQPTKGLESRKTFSKAEIMIRIKCDVHPWMSAWAGVVDHPFFAVTDEAGGYSISGLSPGTYTVEVWHETYVSLSKDVEVGKAGDTSLDFIMEKRKRR